MQSVITGILIFLNGEENGFTDIEENFIKKLHLRLSIVSSESPNRKFIVHSRGQDNLVVRRKAILKYVRVRAEIMSECCLPLNNLSVEVITHSQQVTSAPA